MSGLVECPWCHHNLAIPERSEYPGHSPSDSRLIDHWGSGECEPLVEQDAEDGIRDLEATLAVEASRQHRSDDDGGVS